MTNILDVIGHTPMVRLQHLFADCDFLVLAKLEGINPGGSLKDRPALNIVRKALSQGIIKPGSTIIESSSGNMGVGLAQACAFYRLPFICVVDPKTTAQNISILKAYGATVEMVSRPDPVTGEFLPMRIRRVKELIREIPDSYWPNQYANVGNTEAHFQTMQEIAEALNNKVDHLFCGVSTCGTLSGCSKYIRRHNLKTRVWAVDALGSVLFGGSPGKRLIPGHGAALVPQLYKPHLEDFHVHITDFECIKACRRLVAEEAILAGGSSGATVAALDKVKIDIPRNSTCVLIFADRGERYLDTIYSDTWVEEHFGGEQFAASERGPWAVVPHGNGVTV